MKAGILPSRQELLSRIELVCDLDSSFVAVTGDPGIGKSALLEFFMEHHCLDRQKCFVCATKDQTSHQIREQLLFQLMPGSAYDPHLSIAQNLATAQLPEPLSVIIIIDNGQFIPGDLFKELIELLKADIEHRFGVIFAQPMNAERSSQLNSRHPLIEIHLEPLTKAESRMLLEFYYRAMIDSDRVQVQRFIDQCDGLPAKLLKWEDTDKKPAAKSGGKSSKKAIVITAVVITLTSVVAAAGWFFIPREQLIEHIDEPAEVIAQTGESQQQVEDALAQDDVDTEQLESPELPVDDSAEQAELTEQNESPLDSLLVQKWDNTQKKPVAAKTDSLPTKAAIVAATQDAVEEQSVQEQTDQPDNKDIVEQAQTTDDSASEVADDNASAENAVVEATPIDNTTVESTPEETAPQQTPNNDKMDNQWFMSQSDTQTVIQLTGVSNAAVLETYLVEHQLKSTTRIYQSTRNGNPWYVVTTGPFANRNDAQQAIAQLSAPLRASQPWVKSIRTIQSEITNAKKDANKKNQ